nr:isoform 3 of serine/arginine-rich splicing factor rsz21 [Quercus suber]
MKFCSVWVAQRPPEYPFVEFDDHKDPLNAIHTLDGQYGASLKKVFLEQPKILLWIYFSPADAICGMQNFYIKVDDVFHVNIRWRQGY